MAARGWWLVAAAATGSFAVVSGLAAAALPAKSAHFSGRTSQHRLVTFRSKANRRAITGVTIGTVGPPPRGIKVFCSDDPNDYIDTRVSVEGMIGVTKEGRFTVRAHVRGRIQEGDFRMHGHFRTPRRATGTLRLDSVRFRDGAACTSGRLTFAVRER